MRRQAVTLLLAIVASGTFGFVSVASDQQKPTRVNIIHSEFMEPPPSLAEMCQAADAVVYGRILGGTAKAVGYYRKSDPGPTTYYRFGVHDVIHALGGRHVASKELTILRNGGTLDRGKWVERADVDDYPQFELGHGYVLFLRWNEEHEAWTPKWGPHGTFEVKSGKVRSYGSAEIAKSLDGLTIDEFLTKVREMR